LAEVHAQAEILSINGRPIIAADCKDDPDDRNAGSPTSAYKGEATEDTTVCNLLAYLQVHTQECERCVGKDGKNKGMIVTCMACKQTMTQVLSLLDTACAGVCSDTIISDYLCESVHSMSGGGNCDPIMLMEYLADTMFMDGDMFMHSDSYFGSGSPFDEMFDHFQDLGFKGYDPSKMDQLMSGKDGLVDNEMGGHAMGGYGGMKYMNDYYDDIFWSKSSNSRRLQHVFHNRDSVDNLDVTIKSHFCNDASETCGSDKKLHLTHYGITHKDDDPNEDDDPGDYAEKRIRHLSKSIDPTPAVRVSILTRICDQVEDLKKEDNFMRELLPMVGNRLIEYATAWKTVPVHLPIHPHCDADFEESLVRDAIKIEAPNDEDQLGISCPAPQISAQSSQMRSLDKSWHRALASVFWEG